MNKIMGKLKEHYKIIENMGYYPFEKDGYYTVVYMDDETSSYPPFYPIWSLII